MNNQRIISILKAVISLTLIGVILISINLSDFIDILPRFNLLFFPLLITMILLNISLYVINYWFLLEKKFPLNETLRDYFGVWAISLFLPGKIGELGIIPIIKQKYGLPYTTITLSTIIPKFALLGVLLLFFLLGITVIGEFAIAGITLIAILLGMIICWFLRRQFFELFKKIFSNFKTFSFIFKHEMAIRKLFSKENLYIIGLIGITRFFSFFILTYFSYVAFGYSP
jgi:hypothetical protein